MGNLKLSGERLDWQTLIHLFMDSQQLPIPEDRAIKAYWCDIERQRELAKVAERKVDDDLISVWSLL